MTLFRAPRIQETTHGFSLVEILVGIVVLGVALTGLTQGIQGALHGSKENEVISIASELAAERVEVLRASGFYLAGSSEGLFQEPAGYSYRETLTESSLQGLFEVVVDISRTNSPKRLYRLETLLFEPPLEVDSEVDREERAKERRLNR